MNNTLQEPSVRKGDEVIVTIESLAYGGMGIGRVGPFVVFVKQGLPGQTVKVFVYKKRKGFAEARIVEILTESPDATEPVCEHFPICGGCKHQHLSYEKQVEQKRNQVQDIFQRLGGYESVPIDTVIPADSIYEYRNKMEFTISNRRWVDQNEPEEAKKDFALGLHIPGRFDKILDINQCHIQPSIGNKILSIVRQTAMEHNLKPYDVRTHNGYLRHLMLRFGSQTNDIMVNIVTSYEKTEFLKPIVDILLEKVPEITCIINNINTRKADVAYGEYEILLHGKPVITEKIGDLNFEISANSFFQTNTMQGEALYNVAMEKASLTDEEIVWDLYCGTGTITLFLAQKAKEAYGFELIRSSIEDANRNAILNGIGNAFFIKANLDTFLKGTNRHQFPPPDVIVIDPPRAGMHEDTVKLIPKIAPNRVVYISCNPTTQARDIALLSKRGFDLKSLTVVDMFPHTPHIETVALLVNRRTLQD